MDWFLYDIGLRHERVKGTSNAAYDSECLVNSLNVKVSYFKPSWGYYNS